VHYLGESSGVQDFIHASQDKNYPQKQAAAKEDPLVQEKQLILFGIVFFDSGHNLLPII